MKTEIIKGYMTPSSEQIGVISEQPIMGMSSYGANGTIEVGKLDNWGEM